MIRLDQFFQCCRRSSLVNSSLKFYLIIGDGGPHGNQLFGFSSGFTHELIIVYSLAYSIFQLYLVFDSRLMEAKLKVGYFLFLKYDFWSFYLFPDSSFGAHHTLV